MAAPKGAAVNEPTLPLARAFDFAARKHAYQRRLGGRAEPYINHLAEVASLLAEATDGQDFSLVVAGLLHDTIEDTDTSDAELSQRFGAPIAALVAEVTDDKNMEKEQRKRLQIENASRKSRRAKMIKLADLTSNLRSLVHDPPEEWSAERRAAYVQWAGQVADGLRAANARLEEWFDKAHAAANEATANEGATIGS